MFRLPPMFQPFFPSLFALIGTNDATHALRRLIEDPNPQRAHRIDPQYRSLRTRRPAPCFPQDTYPQQHSEQEACAFAMGALKDSSSLAKLKKLAPSPSENIKIASILALKELGDRSEIPSLTELARSHNIFAISAFGSIPGSENCSPNSSTQGISQSESTPPLRSYSVAMSAALRTQGSPHFRCAGSCFLPAAIGWRHDGHLEGRSFGGIAQ